LVILSQDGGLILLSILTSPAGELVNKVISPSESDNEGYHAKVYEVGTQNPFDGKEQEIFASGTLVIPKDAVSVTSRLGAQGLTSLQTLQI
jgi:hypothetical protein